MLKELFRRLNRFYIGHFQNTPISKHFSAMLLYLLTGPQESGYANVVTLYRRLYIL